MKITGIETIIPGDQSPLPEVVFVRVYTDIGVVGHGETYYTPRAVSEYIHEFLAPRILAAESGSPEAIWDIGYSAAARFGGRGLELRALSAIDIAVWDALALSLNVPLHVLLGGPSVSQIPVYNTCGGPSYGKSLRFGEISSRDGRYEDFDAFMNRPDELAADLVAEGFGGMKIWPFDRIAQRAGGQIISSEDLQTALLPFRKIREAVGSKINIMAEGHGLWSLSAAKRIAKELEQFEPSWIEDLILADSTEALLELKRSTSIPMVVSEYLISRFAYAPVIDQHAVDVVMIDPTWCGGITEARRIVALADAKRLSVTFHDCTGPFTLLAGVHLSFSSPNVMYQEVVRAYLKIVYPNFVDDLQLPEHGMYKPPTRPGIGAILQPDIVDRPGVTVQLSGSR